ncbi:hypothetical protein Hamer_G017630 [Homarus americanus]|uniref:Uncharacterized protein n=1 Tax=Homarus americanus TaxID=6706 RepID=A0A8J5JAI0_HOMAM|nr:hypothetical protein Hamer_G017630 [Homarus americanus]
MMMMMLRKLVAQLKKFDVFYVQPAEPPSGIKGDDGDDERTRIFLLSLATRDIAPNDVLNDLTAEHR